MDGQELSQLIEDRWSTLHQLLEISSRQMDAIRGGRMSELMRLLSEKQKPLTQLVAVADQIRLASEDDHAARHWQSDTQRQRCREQQEECERMHLELLAIEAECETALQHSRATLAQRIDRIDTGQAAAKGYASVDRPPASGATLDLSSL